MSSTSHPTYQLTQHPLGSKREFWALTWPLMIGLVSSTFMMFVDRLFLAQFDPLALNAAASAGLAYWIFLVIPMGITAIAEVLAGRLHGEGKLKEVGSASLQMVWFSLLLAPLFFLIAFVMPQILFAGSGNELFEGEYFTTLCLFGPAHCINIALSGFFIGIGRVRIVTYAALLGNFVNIALDYALIFGWGPFPAWGITGAAVATGLSQIAQGGLLALLFWNAYYRKNFGTDQIGFNKEYFLEGLKIGAPSGFGRCAEVIAHFLFLRIVMWSGVEQMAIVSMVQSLYILVSFITESESKGAGAIASNLLGAKLLDPLKRVLISSTLLHCFYTIVLTGIILLFGDQIYALFQPSEGVMSNPLLLETFKQAALYMCLFFLMDGLVWIFIGFLTASGDTRFLFIVSVAVHWIAYLIPTYWLVGVSHGDAATAWAVIAGMNIVNLVIYVNRYRTGKWLKAYHMPAAAS